MVGATHAEKASIAPFAVILGGIFLGQLVTSLFGESAHWWLSSPVYWLIPLETVLGAAVLRWGWPEFGFSRPRGLLTGAGVGVLALAIWLAPRFLGAAPRLEGFDPGFFETTAGWWWNVLVRFARLVVIVPLAEEIFWRGFLARWLIDPNFQRIPFGTFSRQSFAITTLGFCFEHSFADWPAALVTGVLYNFVAWRTRSLAACVVAHAVTNLLLGLYVMRTHEWGYW